MLNPAERKALRAREEAFAAICRKTAAEAVQRVGKICVIFRKRP